MFFVLSWLPCLNTAGEPSEHLEGQWGCVFLMVCKQKKTDTWRLSIRVIDGNKVFKLEMKRFKNFWHCGLYMIMAFLLITSPNICSNTTIWEHVWSGDISAMCCMCQTPDFVLRDLLVSYVKRSIVPLRQKLESMSFHLPSLFSLGNVDTTWDSISDILVQIMKLQPDILAA